jgi:hypothetical protein
MCPGPLSVAVGLPPESIPTLEELYEKVEKEVKEANTLAATSKRVQARTYTNATRVEDVEGLWQLANQFGNKIERLRRLARQVDSVEVHKGTAAPLHREPSMSHVQHPVKPGLVRFADDFYRLRDDTQSPDGRSASTPTSGAKARFHDALPPHTLRDRRPHKHGVLSPLRPLQSAQSRSSSIQSMIPREKYRNPEASLKRRLLRSCLLTYYDTCESQEGLIDRAVQLHCKLGRCY